MIKNVFIAKVFSIAKSFLENLTKEIAETLKTYSPNSDSVMQDKHLG